MMEREINLLPPTIIASRSLRIYLERLGRLMRFLVFLSMIVLSVIGLAYLVVWRSFTLVSSPENLKNEHQEEIATQVQKVNSQMVTVKKIISENTDWTPIVPDVLGVMPQELRLTYMGVGADARLLEIRGKFVRRESLIAFQRQLEGLSWVERVESPLSNFQTGGDSRFVLLVVRKEGQ